MKKTISYLLTILLIVSCMNFAASAEETELIAFEDGSYFTVSIKEIGTRASGTKTATKTYTYNSSSGTAVWKAVLTGTFTYTGSSALCTASSCDVTIYDNVWYVVSKTATKSANTATANVTMGEKLLGVTVNKKSATINLTCDANGNLS